MTEVANLRDKGVASAVRMGSRTLSAGRASGIGRERSLALAHATADRTIAAVASPKTLSTMVHDREGIMCWIG